MNFMFSWQKQYLTREIYTLFLPLKRKIHVSSPPCNIYPLYRLGNASMLKESSNLDPSLVCGHFCRDLAVLGLYYHDIGPIFPKTALALSNRLIFSIIIWQGSLGVNPGVLIGSFLVGILPYGPFPWKWS